MPSHRSYPPLGIQCWLIHQIRSFSNGQNPTNLAMSAWSFIYYMCASSPFELIDKVGISWDFRRQVLGALRPPTVPKSLSSPLLSFWPLIPSFSFACVFLSLLPFLVRFSGDWEEVANAMPADRPTGTLAYHFLATGLSASCVPYLCHSLQTLIRSPSHIWSPPLGSCTWPHSVGILENMPQNK